MIGRSQAFRVIDKVAAFEAPVLIEGATGTGKELAARAIHYRSSAFRDWPLAHPGERPTLAWNGRAPLRNSRYG
jgi:transcriptional regulator with AAA-type ATPase domain